MRALVVYESMFGNTQQIAEAHGYRLVAKPQHFYVTDTRGPLVEGELERARSWAAELARASA